MKMNYIYVLGFLIIAAFAVSSVKADIHTINYNNSNMSGIDAPNFVIKVLKYDPYPVNPGDWFDVWIKVQNNGQQDANNVTFELQSLYPFSSNDSLVRNYGIIPGTVSAYNMGMPGDTNEVILKYRVKAADDAPSGDSNLKFGISVGSGAESFTSLPISIGKTKTDFDVVMQQSTTQGTSFALANIGSNPATAVTVSIPEQQNVRVVGADSSIIGNLAEGDFTTVTFQLVPFAFNGTANFTGNRTAGFMGGAVAHTVDVQIAYTDVAGIRNVIDKNVTINIAGNFTNGTFRQGSRLTGTTDILSTYGYPVIGFVLGAIAVFGYNWIKRKK
jgi:hypothetical protein